MIQAMSKLIQDRHGQEKARSSMKRKKELESAYVSMRYSASKLGIEVPDVGTFYDPDRYLIAAQAAMAGPPKWASLAKAAYTMPLDEALTEHKRLVRVLRSPSHEDDREEAEEQGAELKELEAKARRKKKAKPGDGLAKGGPVWVRRWWG